MANAIVTFKIMPESPDVDLEQVKEKAKTILKEEGAKGDLQDKIVPVAFGIKQLFLYAMFQTTDEGVEYEQMAEKIIKLDGVSDAVIEKVDLAMG
ncbi:MAG: hypothetical protein ACMXYA_02670 [Candidatus Woesearchaeota archaeon]